MFAPRNAAQRGGLRQPVADLPLARLTCCAPKVERTWIAALRRFAAALRCRRNAAAMLFAAIGTVPRGRVINLNERRRT